MKKIAFILSVLLNVGLIYLCLKEVQLVLRIVVLQ